MVEVNGQSLTPITLCNMGGDYKTGSKKKGKFIDINADCKAYVVERKKMV